MLKITRELNYVRNKTREKLLRYSYREKSMKTQNYDLEKENAVLPHSGIGASVVEAPTLGSIVYTISNKSLGTPSHFHNIWQENLSVRHLPYRNSVLFIVMRSIVIAPLQHCRGGGGGWTRLPILMMSLGPQNTLSTHFRAIWSRCAKDFCRGL